MNADVALALMAKATAVFAREEQFLSFPISPIVFSAEHLSFQDGSLSPLDALNAMAEFSRRMNIIPDGVVYPPVEDTTMWSVFHDLFSSGLVARSARTQEEERDYQTALALLYDTGPDGLRTPTPRYQAYRQWESAWISAKQVMNQRRVEAEMSADPAVKQSWGRDAPALEKAMNDIAARWQAEGFKDEIEHAFGVFSALGAKSPSAQWEAWRTQFGEGMNLLSAPDGDFFPTGFSPVDALREGAWQSFSVAGDEIPALIAQSPPEMRARLDPGQRVDVDRITFEYTSVGLVRPWAPTDMFSERFWMLPSTERGLSDGSPTPSGRMPGYVSGVVFARNIRTIAKAASPSSGPTPPKKPVTTTTPPILNRDQLATMAVARPMMVARPLAAKSLATVAFRAEAAPHATPPQIAVGALMATPTVRPRVAVAPMRALSAKEVQSVGSAVARLQATGIRRIALPPIGPLPPVLPQPPTPTAPADIQVLAFICRKLPRCPNPDPALTW